jgi:hypothetical protein
MMYIRKGATSKKIAPSLIIPMSLRLVIPQWVALQQCPLPLHQPITNLVLLPVFLQTISSTFSGEATNAISSTFLNEATGAPA